MKQWPDFLALAGFFILLVSFALKLKWLSIAAAYGYVFAFTIGAAFNADRMDPGGAAANNLWIKWTVSYFIFAMIGLAADCALRLKK